MKILERYVFGAFLSSFVLAFLVLSFVLTIGLFVQIVGYIMDGVPMSLVGEFCLVSLPETLQWSVPLALLVSSVLVFSRMSADSEIAAMRACGVHIVRVMKWPILFALVCSLVGLWVNTEIVPRGHLIRRTLKMRVSVGAGLSVLEPGHMIDDFPKVKLYFSAKEGNWLYDVVAQDFSGTIDRTITAEKALVTQEGDDIKLDLYQMTVDPLDEKHRTAARFGRFVYTIKNVLDSGEYDPSPKDMRLKAILGEIKRLEGLKDGKEVSSAKVELMKRFVFALASVCFVLIGIPLGIRSQRKESSIGMAISLAVALGYYIFVILMLSFEFAEAIHPEYLIWTPVVLSGVLAVHFTRKHL